jgi:rfaE bifunctional protein kinase chain/domain
VEKINLTNLFRQFNELNVLIIGDVMIDAYYWGRVDRISPEAPVPIVAVEKSEKRLGGAANVALNIQAMGANAILCAPVGDDNGGKEFTTLLEQNKLSTEGILPITNRTTTEKTRIIGNNFQMLRIDNETTEVISKEETHQFIGRINEIIATYKIDVIIFEDYDKGAISKELINQVVDIARDKGIPTTVDPKKRNFSSYKNVTLFKPNLKELKEGLKIEFDKKDKQALERAIDQLEDVLQNEQTLITLSELGVYIKAKSEKHHISAHHRSITDVSGAGDTVISIASLCLALNMPPSVTAELSNLAGGLVCEKVGVVSIQKDQLLKEAIEIFK